MFALESAGALVGLGTEIGTMDFPDVGKVFDVAEGKAVVLLWA